MEHRVESTMLANNFLLRRCAAVLLLVALVVQSITCLETTKQANAVSESSSTEESNFKSDSSSALTTNAQKTITDQNSFQTSNIPAIAEPSAAVTPNSLPSYPYMVDYELPDYNDENFQPLELDMFYHHQPDEYTYASNEDEFRKLLESQGLFITKIPEDESPKQEPKDKRFMRGLNFKRDFEVVDGSDGELENEKRFMRGFSRNAKNDEKRFMRGLRDFDNVYDKRFIVGLNRYGRPSDKRFMRGFGSNGKRFIHGLQNYGKRFMRGLTKRDQEDALEASASGYQFGFGGHVEGGPSVLSDDMEKRFMKGLHAYNSGVAGKRFMKGLRVYSKKETPNESEVFDEENDIVDEKRFMRGLAKKYTGFDNDNEEIATRSGSSDKRFIKGLVGRSRVGKNIEDKRFMKGLVGRSGVMENTDKRFIKGLVGRSGVFENMDKRFMKGLVGRSEVAKNMDDKRFIKGLVGRSGVVENTDKRFMKGLLKKSSDDLEENEKRFIKGLVRKSEADKRFMRGLNKKSSDSEEKRFIKGLSKKDETFQADSTNNEGNDDKRFMRGFGKKNVEEDELEEVADKRFMRGLNMKKSQNLLGDESKRFMKGFKNLAKKDHKVSDEDINDSPDHQIELGSGEDKRFIIGLTRHGHSSKDKRFIKGLVNYVKKDEASTSQETSESVNDKRFIKGLTKKESESTNKRFIKGLGKKSDNSENTDYVDGYDNAADENNELDKRFMRGLTKKEASDDKVDKKFIKDFRKTDEKNADKRFIKGLVKREATLSRDKRETRFDDENDEDFKGQSDESEDELLDTDDSGSWYDLPRYDDELSFNKRFMRGLGQHAKRNHQYSETDDTDDMEISKRFLRGFINYYGNNNGKEYLPKRYQYSLTKPGDYDTQPLLGKRFIKGLGGYSRPVNGKRFIMGDLERLRGPNSNYNYVQDKRFMRGLSPYIHSAEKRFIRGFGKYMKRPIESTQLQNPYLTRTQNKRFISRSQHLVPDDQQSQQSALDKQLEYIRDFYSDQQNPFQPKRDITLYSDPYSSGNSGIQSRRFVAWRNGEYVQG